MTWSRHVLIAALAAGSLGSADPCGGIAQLPDPDTCAAVAGAAAAGVELGEGDFDEVFRPWSEDAKVVLVLDGGTSTIRTRLRVRGPGTAGCMAQITRVLAGDGTMLGQTDRAVGFYDQGDGTRLTRTIFVSLAHQAHDGKTVRVEATVGGTTASRTVRLADPP